MPNYRRRRLPGGCYFFTVATLERSRGLLTTHIDRLRSAFRLVRHRYPFTIDAVVVLPDHLHCVWTLPTQDDDFSTRWRLIKSTFSKSLPTHDRTSPSRGSKRERGVWQRRFWEHAIRDENDFEQHVEYIHYNPVKHGYTKRPIDWPFSSFHRYVKRGLYPLHWGTAEINMNVSYDEYGRVTAR